MWLNTTCEAKEPPPKLVRTAELRTKGEQHMITNVAGTGFLSTLVNLFAAIFAGMS
jgi:hypothetical protein